jgi:hypothetical protein
MAYVGNVPAVAYTNTVKDTFSGDGSTVAFTMSLPTTTNNVRVVVENVIQDPTVAYSVSGTTLTFTSAPPSGTDNIYVVHLGPAVQTVQPPTQLSGNFTLTGDLAQTGDYTLTGAASVSGSVEATSIRTATLSDAAGTGPVTLTGQFAAKAWVNFNGTGTVAIRDSENVTSITDNGTGDYTTNFSNAFTGTTGGYSATVSQMRFSTGSFNDITQIEANGQLAGSIRTRTSTVSANFDPVAVYIAVHGDLA